MVCNLDVESRTVQEYTVLPPALKIWMNGKTASHALPWMEIEMSCFVFLFVLTTYQVYHDICQGPAVRVNN